MENSKNYYLDILNTIEKNLLGTRNSKEGALKFFRSDSISFEICFKIMKNYYRNETTHFENLYKEMNAGSRQKIKTILSDARQLKYITITENQIDARKQDIMPSKQTINEFENHLEELKQKLNNI